MSVLRFETEEALRFTITSGLLPASVAGGTARVWRDAEGGILVAPGERVPPESLKKLVAAGVSRVRVPEEAPMPDAGAVVQCWAEIVSVVPAKPDPQQAVGVALFYVPDGASLTELAGELIRLGCDRLEWRAVPAGHLLRVAAPPYYSLLRATEKAIDGEAGLRVYVPAPEGQDRVWIEAGYEHPLARFLRPDEGSVLLVAPGVERGSFTVVPDGPFADIYTLVDLRMPGDEGARVLAGAPEPPPLRVVLRLGRANAAAAPSLWVVRDGAIAKVERLLASLPEEIARGLLFAVCEGGDGPIVVLRTRLGASGAVEIDGEPYRAHAAIANLFLPCDATLEPPIRRDRARDLLAPEPDDVVWLRALDGGRFRVERAEDAAFQPLSEWVEYVIDTNAPALVPWVKSCTFDFDAFVGVEAKAEPDEPPKAPEPKSRAKAARADRPTKAGRVEVPPPAAASAPAPVTLVAARIDPNVAAQELAVLEQDYVASEAALDDPSRLTLLAQMAPLHLALGRGNDAALCWSRVVWEAPRSSLRAAVEPWLSAEHGLVRAASAKALLALDVPSREHVRALAVRLVAADEVSLREVAHEASLWLDRHDEVLDVQTSWLARVALSHGAGGDRLGLARARDRLLARIHGGLSLERDVPALMRRTGRGRDAAQIELLAAKLDALVEAFEKTKRRRSANEANPKLTGAYVRFVVAYGCARLGLPERAVELRDAAVAALPPDPVHDVLSRSYVARISQALEGLSAETPLPSAISSSLNALAKLDRYKVDRVRQASRVLEPHERLDPIIAFQRGEADPRGPEFAELRGEPDPVVVERGILAVIAKAKGQGPAERTRLYDGAMDFFPMLALERAVELLDVLLADIVDVPPLARISLLEEALMLAGHLGEESLARRIFAILEPLVGSVGAESAAEVAPVAAGMLRTLRRFGLRDEAKRLLGALQTAAKGGATPHLLARLHIAAAFAHLGEIERARPVFEEALAALNGTPPMPERLALTRTLARSLALAPIAYAVAGLEQIRRRLDVVTDSFNTNTHVCLSVLDFMESLVLGYASDELALDPVARRLLDDDEYLVRRRIHQDLSAESGTR